MAVHGIVLDYSITPQPTDDIGAVRLTVVASRGNNMPNEIFIHAIAPRQSSDDEDHIYTEARGICSPPDLENLAANTPESGGEVAFRQDFIDIVFESRYLVDQAITEINDQVQNLVDALDKLDVQEALSTVEFGTPADA